MKPRRQTALRCNRLLGITKNMNIPIRVVTNVDHLKSLTWPKDVCCRPMPGDYLEASNRQRAKVMSVTHTETVRGEPKLEVEVWTQPKP